ANPVLGSPALGAPGLRPRSRAGPGDGRRADLVRRRRLREDAARGDPAGRHGRPEPAEGARRRPRRRHRQVRLDGRLPLQHVQPQCRLADPGRAQGGHRQGGDPAGRGGPERPGRVRRRGLRRERPLGRPDEAARWRRRSRGCARRDPAERDDEHLQWLVPGGRFYAAPDPTTIPHIFLKETQQVAGEQIVEEPFFPIQTGASPILRGLDQGFPQLLGYNGTTAKSASQTILVTARDAPLLAQWQYGLGRSVAWTSDSTGRWAKNWLAWPDFGKFFSQLVGWTFP